MYGISFCFFCIWCPGPAMAVFSFAQKDYKSAQADFAG
jgi:hypothetical protein